MTNSWHRALKEWNAGQPAWCMPRRGSEEHKQVKAIQSRLDREGRVPAPNPARLTAVRERARQTAERAMAYDPYPNPNAPEPIVEAPVAVVAPDPPPLPRKPRPPKRKSPPTYTTPPPLPRKPRPPKRKSPPTYTTPPPLPRKPRPPKKKSAPVPKKKSAPVPKKKSVKAGVEESKAGVEESKAGSDESEDEAVEESEVWRYGKGDWNKGGKWHTLAIGKEVKTKPIGDLTDIPTEELDAFVLKLYRDIPQKSEWKWKGKQREDDRKVAEEMYYIAKKEEQLVALQGNMWKGLTYEMLPYIEAGIKLKNLVVVADPRGRFVRFMFDRNIGVKGTFRVYAKCPECLERLGGEEGFFGRARTDLAYGAIPTNVKTGIKEHNKSAKHKKSIQEIGTLPTEEVLFINQFPNEASYRAYIEEMKEAQHRRNIKHSIHFIGSGGDKRDLPPKYQDHPEVLKGLVGFEVPDPKYNEDLLKYIKKNANQRSNGYERAWNIRKNSESNEWVRDEERLAREREERNKRWAEGAEERAKKQAEREAKEKAERERSIAEYEKMLRDNPITEEKDEILKISHYNAEIVKPPEVYIDQKIENRMSFLYGRLLNGIPRMYSKAQEKIYSEGVKSDWKDNFKKWGLDTRGWRVNKKGQIYTNTPKKYEDWIDFVKNFVEEAKKAKAKKAEATQEQEEVEESKAGAEESDGEAEESKAEAEESKAEAEESKAGEPPPLTEEQEELLKIAIYNKGIVKPPTGSKEDFKANSRRLDRVGAMNHPNSVIEQYKRELKEGVKNGDWEGDFINWGIDSDDWEVKKKLIVPMNNNPDIYGDWSDFIEYYIGRLPQRGNGMVQLGSRLYEPTYRPSQQQLDMARKEMIGKGYMVGGGQHDEENWEDYNVNIIGEAEEAGVPVPTELSVVNSVYDLFSPKAPQVNKQTGALRPAPGLFSFLNFNI